MKICSVENCEKQVNSRGLCSAHYHRWRTSDTGKKEKMQGYGERRKHPLYENWRWLNRLPKEEVCSGWEEFWDFVKDVGEKPNPKSIFRRKDAKSPFSKDNWEWVHKGVSKKDPVSYSAYLKAYRKERLKKYPEEQRDRSLRKNYGIRLEFYNDLLEAQNSVCAICGSPPNPRGGRDGVLCVDHCHVSGNVRELLCNACNIGLGSFKDKPELLKKAIAYLKKHAST